MRFSAITTKHKRPALRLEADTDADQVMLNRGGEEIALSRDELPWLARSAMELALQLDQFEEDRATDDY